MDGRQSGIGTEIYCTTVSIVTDPQAEEQRSKLLYDGARRGSRVDRSWPRTPTKQANYTPETSSTLPVLSPSSSSGTPTLSSSVSCRFVSGVSFATPEVAAALDLAGAAADEQDRQVVVQCAGCCC